VSWCHCKIQGEMLGHDKERRLKQFKDHVLILKVDPLIKRSKKTQKE